MSSLFLLKPSGKYIQIYMKGLKFLMKHIFALFVMGAILCGLLSACTDSSDSNDVT